MQGGLDPDASLEGLEEVVLRGERFSVHADQIVPFFDVESRSAQGTRKLRVPRFPGEDAVDPPPSFARGKGIPYGLQK